jgi:hypothetical protein
MVTSAHRLHDRQGQVHRSRTLRPLLHVEAHAIIFLKVGKVGALRQLRAVEAHVLAAIDIYPVYAAAFAKSSNTMAD